jgi:hypothetical protein
MLLLLPFLLIVLSLLEVIQIQILILTIHFSTISGTILAVASSLAIWQVGSVWD